MAINFPATPTLNQTYTFNGRTWTYNGVGWQATGASGLSVYTKTDFTATAAQTTFSVTYTVGFVDVYYNGSKLSITEYTATNGTSVVLGTACALNDIVETVAWTVSTTLNPALGVATATSLAIGGATIGSNALAVTGTTQLNSALNYGGVTLSNAVTGTGNMVLSAGPTLTGTLTIDALTAATNKLTVSSVGVGMGTSPNASYALIVNGAGFFNSAFTIQGALNYGGVTLSNSVTGTGSMVLSASPTFTGTALASKLRVAGGVGGNSLVVDKAGSASNRLQIFVGDGTGGTTADENYIASNNTGLHFWAGATGTTEFMTLTNTGFLGIGTTPANPLHVYGSFGSSAAIYVQQNPSVAGSAILKLSSAGAGGNVSGVQYNDYYIYRDAAFGGLAFGASTTYASASMILDSSGNLGLGTTGGMGFAGYNVLGIGPGSSAGGILQFQGASNADGAHLRLDRTGATINSFMIETRNTFPMTFGINGVEKMRLDTNGYLNLGSTLTSGSGYFTSWDTAGNTSHYGRSSNTTARMLDCIYTDAGTSTPIYFQKNGAQVGGIVINTSATAYNTSSDERLKNFNVPQRDFYAMIQAIDVRDAEFLTNPGDTVLSISAQQVAATGYAEAVTYPEPRMITGLDANGDPVLDDEGRTTARMQTEEEAEANTWSADYGRLAPLALWGVKDLYKIIQELTTRLAALEAK